MDKIEAAARIRKVLALTSSSEEHEAALAALRVQQLLAQYHLTLDEVQASELGETTLSSSGPWQDTLLRIVAQACGCVAVTLAYRAGNMIAVLGTTLDRETAFDMYERLVLVLANRVEEAWQAHRAELTDPVLGVHPALTEEGAEAEWRDSYVAGALSRLHQRIADPQTHRYASEPAKGLTLDALVLVTDVRQQAAERAKAFAAQRYGLLRTKQAELTLVPSAVRQGQREHLT